MIVIIPAASFIPKAITWSPDDKAVLLKGKSHFCVFFPRPDEDVGDEKERVVGDASDNTTETVTSAHWKGAHVTHVNNVDQISVCIQIEWKGFERHEHMNISQIEWCDQVSINYRWT